MTVGADEFAFLELLKYCLTRSTGDHHAHLIDLLKSGQMIPMHYIDRERLPAVNARNTGLDVRHPDARFVPPHAPARESHRAAALVVVTTVVFIATVTAVRELAGT